MPKNKHFKYAILILAIIGIVFVGGCGLKKPVACTEEAKICPDGSIVVRIPPGCEFQECPELKVDEEGAEIEKEKVNEIVDQEFQVNSSTDGTQYSPSIAYSASGNFVITWSSKGKGDNNGIYAQRYDPDGNRVGDEFRVNTYTKGSQSNPDITMSKNGDIFVITWESWGQDGDDLGIFAQRYDFNGNRLGDEFQVNNYTDSAQNHPHIASDVVGNFVIVWKSFREKTWWIYSQKFNFNGHRLGSEFKIDANSNGFQSQPDVSMNMYGRFVITWVDNGQSPGIYAQRYSFEGDALDDKYKVNSSTQGRATSPAVVVNASGDFIIAWSRHEKRQDIPGGSIYYEDGNGIYAQRYNSNGNAIGKNFKVNTVTDGSHNCSSITFSKDSNFIIAWSRGFYEGIKPGIYARKYDSYGNSSRDEFRVNTYELDGRNTLPSIASDLSSNFTITWTSYGQDGDEYGIYARRYNVDE